MPTIEPVKVLFFVDHLFHAGIQSFIVDYICHSDRSKVQVDLLTMDDGMYYPLEETIRDMGIKVYRLEGVWIRKPQDFLHQARALDAFFSDHQTYDAVHLHSSSKNFNVLRVAKKYGVPVRIAHSHNNQFQSTRKPDIWLGQLLRHPLKHFSTHFFACSDLAGEWLFGKRVLSLPNYSVIPNAIDIDKFAFRPYERERVRREYGLADKFVIGSVGRFDPQKNHPFLLRIFQEIAGQCPDARLVLIGEGAQRGEIERLASENGVKDKVLFLGFRSDTDSLLNAFDVFVLPSLFEGFGIVLIEAQANGLPCFASQGVISDRARVTDNFTFIPLQRSPVEWAEKILIANTRCKDATDAVRAAGFDVNVASKRLDAFYLAIKEDPRAVMSAV